MWGERLAEVVKAVQQHAQPGDALASQDVLTLAPDALKLSSDMAKGTLAHSLLLIGSVRLNPQPQPPPLDPSPDPLTKRGSHRIRMGSSLTPRPPNPR